MRNTEVPFKLNYDRKLPLVSRKLTARRAVAAGFFLLGLIASFPEYLGHHRAASGRGERRFYLEVISSRVEGATPGIAAIYVRDSADDVRAERRHNGQWWGFEFWSIYYSTYSGKNGYVYSLTVPFWFWQVVFFATSILLYFDRIRARANWRMRSRPG